jgi:hypothetical protein
MSNPLRAALWRAITIFAVATAIVANGSALTRAETHRLTVPAGRESRIGDFYIYTLVTCHAGPRPKFVVARKPANGEIILRPVRKMIRPKRRCAEFAANGWEVHYRPLPGFRGEDRAEISFVFQGHADPSAPNRRMRRRYLLTVK